MRGGLVGVRGAAVLAALLCLWAVPAAAVGGAESSDGVWRFSDAPPDGHERARPWVRPDFFRGALLDIGALKIILLEAPLEFTPEARQRPVLIELPMPDGAYQRFEVVRSPVMAPELAEAFPELLTYSGQGLDDPTAVLRMDVTPLGFHAQVLSGEWSVYIDPYSFGDVSFYAVYERNDLRDKARDGWVCLGVLEEPHLGQPPLRLRSQEAVRSTGAVLKTYRTAVAATGEYTAFWGGTVAGGMNGIVTAINRVTGVYERDFGIRLQLVANNNLIVYTNAATDPFTNNDAFAMISQVQSTIDSVIGSANYDLGHVFSTGGGGLASLAVACRSGVKARGVTGLPSPTGDVFFIDYVAHEIGHQFGANHSFNGLAGACCCGNRNSSTAYEPGSGSTIMAYAGICSGDNLQSTSHDYFTSISYDEIVSYVFSGLGGCPPSVPTGNSPPVVSAGAALVIPRSTPFTLTAVATDPDGDALTYCWEQRNLGSVSGQSATNGIFIDLGSNPIIRSFPPAMSPSRTVPRLPDLLAGSATIGETLPTTTRTLRFRCTVRDNRAGGGGVGFGQVDLSVTANAGPFRVTAPSGGEVFTGGATLVQWDVAGTTGNGINCSTVRIELSTDGGQTWPHLLEAGVPNTGSRTVSFPPSLSTTQARVRVSCVGNIFFNISNANFTLAPPAAPGSFSLITPASGATGVSLTPTLSWSASAGAASYTVVLDQGATLSAPFLLSQTIAGTTLALPPGLLAHDTQYAWRVTASNDAGSTISTPETASFRTAPPPFCPGDASGDRAVDFADITAVLLHFGASYPPGSAGPGDANNDGIVNFIDVTAVLDNWLAPCP